MPSLGGPPLALGDVYEVSVNGLCAAQAFVNRYHFLCTAAVAGDGFLDVLAALQTRLQVNIYPYLAVGFSATKYKLKKIDFVTTAAGPPVTYPVTYDTQAEIPGNVADVGTLATDALPTYAAASVRVQTALVGKSFRGSKRYGPLVEAQTLAGSGNQLTATMISNFTAGANTLTVPFAYFAGSECKWVVWSAKQTYLLSPTNPAVGATLVTSCVCNTYLGSQVSRKQRNP